MKIPKSTRNTLITELNSVYDDLQCEMTKTEGYRGKAALLKALSIIRKRIKKIRDGG